MTLFETTTLPLLGCSSNGIPSTSTRARHMISILQVSTIATTSLGAEQLRKHKHAVWGLAVTVMRVFVIEAPQY